MHETILQTPGMRIHDKADLDSTHAEVSQNLRFTGGDDCCDSFDLQDDRVRDDDVRTESHRDCPSLVYDGEQDLCIRRGAGPRVQRGFWRRPTPNAGIRDRSSPVIRAQLSDALRLPGR